mmetsp:Transcript_19693/g.58362  ORF Transcript_19693/g.58362 Transcript_19693/m.58362 type:complete len:375 (+) Transcript_19693:623-1747(+)
MRHVQGVDGHVRRRRRRRSFRRRLGGQLFQRGPLAGRDLLLQRGPLLERRPVLGGRRLLELGVRGREREVRRRALDVVVEAVARAPVQHALLVVERFPSLRVLLRRGLGSFPLALLALAAVLLALVFFFFQYLELLELLGGPLVQEEARVGIRLQTPRLALEHRVDFGKVGAALDFRRVVALARRRGHRRLRKVAAGRARRVDARVELILLVGRREAHDLGLGERRDARLDRGQLLGERRRARLGLKDARLDGLRLGEEALEHLRRVVRQQADLHERARHGGLADVLEDGLARRAFRRVVEMRVPVLERAADAAPGERHLAGATARSLLVRVVRRAGSGLAVWCGAPRGGFSSRGAFWLSGPGWPRVSCVSLSS